MLILPHADGLGLDLHQLGKGILHTPGDRDRPPHGDVQVRKLLTGQLGRGIDGGSGLTDDDVVDVRQRLNHLSDQSFRLPGGRAVADGHQIHTMSDDHLMQYGRRLFVSVLRRMGIQGSRRQQATGLIDDGRLTAGAKTRIKPQHLNIPHRRLHQQTVQVAGKDADRLPPGILGQLPSDLPLQSGGEQALVTVQQHILKESSHLGISHLDPMALQILQYVLFGQLDDDPQYFLPLAAINRQDRMGAHLTHGAAEVIVILIGGASASILLGQCAFRTDHRLPLDKPAQGGPSGRIIGDLLSEDVCRARQGLLCITHLRAPRHPFEPGPVGIPGRQGLGQRFETPLFGYRSPRPPLRPVGPVQIFHSLTAVGLTDGGFQFRRQLLLCLQETDYFSLARLQGPPALSLRGDLTQLPLIKAPGDFLPVASHKGNGVSRIQKLQGPDYLIRWHCCL